MGKAREVLQTIVTVHSARNAVQASSATAETKAAFEAACVDVVFELAKLDARADPEEAARRLAREKVQDPLKGNDKDKS